MDHHIEPQIADINKYNIVHSAFRAIAPSLRIMWRVHRRRYCAVGINASSVT